MHNSAWMITAISLVDIPPSFAAFFASSGVRNLLLLLLLLLSPLLGSPPNAAAAVATAAVVGAVVDADTVAAVAVADVVVAAVADVVAAAAAVTSAILGSPCLLHEEVGTEEGSLEVAAAAIAELMRLLSSGKPSLPGAASSPVSMHASAGTKSPICISASASLWYPFGWVGSSTSAALESRTVRSRWPIRM